MTIVIIYFDLGLTIFNYSDKDFDDVICKPPTEPEKNGGCFHSKKI